MEERNIINHIPQDNYIDTGMIEKPISMLFDGQDGMIGGITHSLNENQNTIKFGRPQMYENYHKIEPQYELGLIPYEHLNKNSYSEKNAYADMLQKREMDLGKLSILLSKLNDFVPNKDPLSRPVSAADRALEVTPVFDSIIDVPETTPIFNSLKGSEPEPVEVNTDSVVFNALKATYAASDRVLPADLGEPKPTLRTSPLNLDLLTGIASPNDAFRF